MRGAAGRRSRDDAGPGSLLSSATWKAGNICPSLNCAELLENMLRADPPSSSPAAVRPHPQSTATSSVPALGNRTRGPEIVTAVRQWRLIRGVSNSLDQYTDYGTDVRDLACRRALRLQARCCHSVGVSRRGLGGSSRLRRRVRWPAAPAGPDGWLPAGFHRRRVHRGRLAERGWERRPLTTALAMTLGTLALFVPGLIWLASFVGTRNVLAVGFVPFIPGAVIKIALASLLLPQGWKVLRWLRGTSV